MNDDFTSVGRYRRLRLYNLGMGALHLAQGVAILALSNDFALPVHGTFMEGPPGAQPARLHHLFDLPIGPGCRVVRAGLCGCTRDSRAS